MPAPMAHSLVAAATRMTQRLPNTTAPRATPVHEWQERVWHMYRNVGELRFGVGWLSNALSRVNLIAARPPINAGDEPQPLDVGTADEPGEDWDLRDAAKLVTDIAGGPIGQGQLLAGNTVHMMLPGICYILAETDDSTDLFSSWSVLSQSEVRAKERTDPVVYERQVDHDKWEDIPDSDLLIKVWRQDRQHSWQPDSPARAVLDTLDEIKLCTDHIKATAESRLTGAGLLVFPTEVEFPAPPPPPPPADGSPPEPQGRLDGFIDTLIEVAETSRLDRSSAAARIPIPVTIPADSAANGLPRLLTFATPFDAMVLDVRQAAIQRLALGIELPPEVLTGLGDVNHWSAWQVEESAITLMIEPMAEILCHALTSQYLKVALKLAGVDPESVIVWYDTSDLRVRPDRSDAAVAAYDRVELSGTALLRETGLSEDDTPDDEERNRRLLLSIAMGNGALAAQAVTALGVPMDAPATAPPTGPPGDGAAPESPPATDGPPDRQQAAPDGGAAAALLAAADALVERAMERAGARLRSAVGKRVGGPQSIPCPDPATLHTTVDVNTARVSLDSLLDGAWDRCDVIARRYAVDPVWLRAQLDVYARALLVSRHAHDYDRLAGALGVHAAV